ncbi:MAG: amidohydrolase family protein [Pirellulales bacterium]
MIRQFSRSALALLSMAAVTACASASDQIPGAPQKKPIVIKNGVLHIVSGPNVRAGAVVIKEGKITEIGENVTIPPNAEVIDAKGSHVYPSLIDAQSNIGLVEIDSIRATIDSSETGSINPNVRAAAAFNPDSELIPVARANGVLLAVSAPEGGLISGRSALMMLDGWTWEDMTLKADIGMQLNWPRGFAGFGEGREGRGNREGGPGAGGGGNDLKALEELFTTVQRYAAGVEQDTVRFDSRLKALIPVLKGELPLTVSANSASQIRSAVAFAKKWKLKIRIYGGYDAMDCSELLIQEKIPVIVGGVYRVPSRRDQPYDDAYTLPGRLQKAGVKFCISSAGRFGATGLRNLPYNAATAAGFGLEPDEALRAITLSPAEILGVADRVGSLEPGKDATLFLADGDILETQTQVTAAFVQGRVVDLSNKHTQLYKKYSEKQQQLKESR